ncbi:MAG: ureidoglycolate lyase [Rhodomicrobium sp.]
MDIKADETGFKIIGLKAQELTPEDFGPFGTVIAPEDDGAPFEGQVPALDLSGGTPRFYAMRLPPRGLLVKQITRHVRTTQALASVGGHSWFIAVAPPARLGDPNAEPRIEDIKAFRIPGDKGIILHKGTWHAGPHFEGGSQSFFNLELMDTNVVDHHTCKLTKRYGQALQIAA